MGFTFKEVGRLTIRIFMKFYHNYQDNFDLEMRLRNANVTYKELYERQMKEEEWF